MRVGPSESACRSRPQTTLSCIGNRNWCFFATQKTEGGEANVIDLLYMSTVKIVRHTKIRGNANPYDSRWREYFSKRLIRTHYSAIEPAPCC
jgi:hypothetical protein